MSDLLYSFSTSRIAARSRENFASSVSKPTIDFAAAAAGVRRVARQLQHLRDGLLVGGAQADAALVVLQIVVRSGRPRPPWISIAMLTFGFLKSASTPSRRRAVGQACILPATVISDAPSLTVAISLSIGSSGLTPSSSIFASSMQEA